MRGIEHVHLVQDPLRPQLLQDTDDRVADDHRQEGQVPVGAHQAQQHCQDQEDQVEIGKEIGSYNLSRGLVGGDVADIHEPSGHALLHLFGREAGQGFRAPADQTVSGGLVCALVFEFHFIHPICADCFVHVFHSANTFISKECPSFILCDSIPFFSKNNAEVHLNFS